MTSTWNFRRNERAKAVDAEVCRVTAIRIRATRFLGMCTARSRSRIADQSFAQTGRSAKTLAALIAGHALLSIAATRIEHPEATRVTGDQFLRG